MASHGQGGRPLPQFAPRTGGASRYAQIVIKEPNTSEPKKAKRKRITPEQLKELTAVFDKTDTPTHDIREELSKQLGMTNREVQVWFQNRRAKYNRLRIEQQRQMRANAEILFRSGLMAGRGLPGRLPVPMPAPLPISAPVPMSPHRHQQHPAYGYPNGLPCQPATVISPGPGDVARHAVSAEATPLTPTAVYSQYSHVQPSPDFAGIVPRVSTPLASAPVLYGPLSPSSPEHVHLCTGQNLEPGFALHAPPTTRRNTVSTYRNVGAMSPPPQRAPVYEAGTAAAARARYLSAVPNENQVGPIKLPSIRAMLAGTDSTRRPDSAEVCVSQSPLRMRAFTSPSPAVADAASRQPRAEVAAAEPAPGVQEPIPLTDHSQAPAQDSGSQRHCSGHRAGTSSEAQFRDAKMGIDVLATAAISVSSAKSSGSLPHLTPLSEFSFRTLSQHYGSPSAVPSSPIPQQQQQQQQQQPSPPHHPATSECGGRSGRQSRKMTPVDKGRSWRPW